MYIWSTIKRNMKAKDIISILAVVAIVVICLTSCGKQGNPQPKHSDSTKVAGKTMIMPPNNQTHY